MPLAVRTTARNIVFILMFFFAIASHSAVYQASSSAALSIDGRSHEFSLNIAPSPNETITDVDVVLNFGKSNNTCTSYDLGSSGFPAEIAYTLSSPGSTVVGLIENNFGQAGTGRLQSYTGGYTQGATITLDDSATEAIENSGTPESGSFRPVQPLSGFNGESPAGQWRLTAYDSLSADPLCHQGWTLKVTTDELIEPDLGNPGEWVQVTGQVYFEGTPLCALVLINGQSDFSCGANIGRYDMEVPRDGDGKIETQIFAAGFKPVKQVLGQGQILSHQINMQQASQGDPRFEISFVSSPLRDGWSSISGTVDSNSVPVCALILANGQKMFSCGDNIGRYALEVPLDQDGNVTLQVFAAGFQPHRNTESASDTEVSPGLFVDTVRYSWIRSNRIPLPGGGFSDGGGAVKMHSPDCPVQYIEADIEVLSSSLEVSLIARNGQTESFSLNKSLGNEQQMPGGKSVILRGTSEYLSLEVDNAGSGCKTTLEFDRVNGEVIPPTGNIFGRLLVGCDHRNQMGGSCGQNESPDYTQYPGYLEFTEDFAYGFDFGDLDGWIVSATLEWSQEGGRSETIDLLAESINLEHHKERYLQTREPISGQTYDHWYGYGVFEEKYANFHEGYTVFGYEHWTFNSNNYSQLFGAGVLRGLNVYDWDDGYVGYGEGKLLGDLTLQFTVTDNDGKSYREIWNILAPDGSQEGKLTYHSHQNYYSDPDEWNNQVCWQQRITPSTAAQWNTIEEGEGNPPNTYRPGPCPETTSLACHVEDPLDTGIVEDQIFYLDPANSYSEQECLSAYGGVLN